MLSYCACVVLLQKKGMCTHMGMPAQGSYIAMGGPASENVGSDSHVTSKREYGPNGHRGHSNASLAPIGSFVPLFIYLLGCCSVF